MPYRGNHQPNGNSFLYGPLMEKGASRFNPVDYGLGRDAFGRGALKKVASKWQTRFFLEEGNRL